MSSFHFFSSHVLILIKKKQKCTKTKQKQKNSDIVLIYHILVITSPQLPWGDKLLLLQTLYLKYNLTALVH